MYVIRNEIYGSENREVAGSSILVKEANFVHQSSSGMQSSTSQTSSWTTNPQANSPQDAMGIPCAQATPPHASMQMPPFYTGGLPMQEALDFSQLAVEDLDQINEKILEQLNVIHSRCIYRYSYKEH